MNSLQAHSSYLLSSIFKTPVVWGSPSVPGIELTNKCNLGCAHCPSGSGELTRPAGFMSVDLLKKIVIELEGKVRSSMFYFQGESMMHPDFFEMLRIAEPLNPLISTNGHFLDESSSRLLSKLMFKKIIVSMDGISNDTYLKYRKGGDLSRVKEGILNLNEELRQKNRNHLLEIQTLISSTNEHEIDKILEFGAMNSISVRFKSMQIYRNESELLPGIKAYRRYRIRNGHLYRRGKLYNRCRRLWTSPVITWDGNVVPCCFDKDAQYIMGNIKNNSIKEIWKGEKYQRFRREILHNRAGIDICNNCTSGLPISVKI